jgi:hypothetical protein
LLANVTIAGVASSIPKKVVTNTELESLVETSDEWITKRTGIHTRHVAVEKRRWDGSRFRGKGTGNVRRTKDPWAHRRLHDHGEDLTPSMAGSVQKALGIQQARRLTFPPDAPLYLRAGHRRSLMDTWTWRRQSSSRARRCRTIRTGATLHLRALWGRRGRGGAAAQRDAARTVSNSECGADRRVIVLKKDARSTPFAPTDDTTKEYIRMKGATCLLRGGRARRHAQETLRALRGKPFTKVIPHQQTRRSSTTSCGR